MLYLLRLNWKFFQAVDEGSVSKNVIYKKFGVPNSNLYTIITNRDKIVKNFESSKFEPDRKRLNKANYETIEAALLHVSNKHASRMLLCPVPFWRRLTSLLERWD